MTLFDHALDDFGERRFDIEGDNIDARHHHIGSGLIVDLQNVANQQTLVSAEWARIVGGRFLDHFVDRFTQTFAVPRASKQPQETAQTGESSVRLVIAATTRRLGVAHF